ncbi:hypothetical protein DFH06DRAFT_1136716 [Mycena polygramma]|nr:hypothetical protein DFH06DRAFT_1136716 [Mycena polygramma]
MKLIFTTSFLALLAAAGTVSATPVSSLLTAKGLDFCFFEGIACDFTEYALCVTAKVQPDRAHGHCCSAKNPEDSECERFLKDECKLTKDVNAWMIILLVEVRTFPIFIYLTSASNCSQECTEILLAPAKSVEANKTTERGIFAYISFRRDPHRNVRIRYGSKYVSTDHLRHTYGEPRKIIKPTRYGTVKYGRIRDTYGRIHASLLANFGAVSGLLEASEPRWMPLRNPKVADDKRLPRTLPVCLTTCEGGAMPRRDHSRLKRFKIDDAHVYGRIRAYGTERTGLPPYTYGHLGRRIEGSRYGHFSVRTTPVDVSHTFNPRPANFKITIRFIRGMFVIVQKLNHFYTPMARLQRDHRPSVQLGGRTLRIGQKVPEHTCLNLYHDTVGSTSDMEGQCRAKPHRKPAINAQWRAVPLGTV